MMAEIVNVPFDKLYTLEAAKIKNYGQWNLHKIDCGELSNLESLKVSDFKLAKFPVDISFNPLRLVKSVLKQVYEVGVKEKLAG
jgi:hypothetical protein